MRHAQVFRSMPSPEDRGSLIVRVRSAMVSARGTLGGYSSAAQLCARPWKSSFCLVKYRQLPLNYNIRPLVALNGAVFKLNVAIRVRRNYI